VPSSILSPLVGLFYRAIEPLGYRPRTQVRAPFKPPVASRLAAMLREGKHDDLRFALSKLHRDSRRSSIEAMLQILNEAESADQWIERLWRWYRESREFHATNALACGLVKYAWLKRGGGAADEVSEHRAQVFREALEEAERLIDKALTAQPNDVDLLCLRLITARGLGLESARHWERFRALIAIDHGHYRGHLAMLENLKAKWGGSHEAMFQFARSRAKQMPEGHPLKALVVFAHFEMRNARFWLDDPNADEYFLAPGVGDEIEQAWQESANSPLFRDESHADELHNLFAAALYLTGRHASARKALGLMDAQCLEMPWSTMGVTPKEQGNPGWVVDRIEAEVNPV
jgi:hypothetical protein